MSSFTGKLIKFSYGGRYKSELATGVYEGVGIEYFITLDERNRNNLQLLKPIFWRFWALVNAERLVNWIAV